MLLSMGLDAHLRNFAQDDWLRDLPLVSLS
jgi:hypothetical protein